MSLKEEKMEIMVRYIENNWQGEMLDVYVLIHSDLAVEDRIESKELIRELVDRGSVVPHPGSTYKVKSD